MKTILFTTTLSALFCAITALAGEPAKPYTGSAEFEKMKSLAGTWKATADMGSGPVTMTTIFRVVSGGSAIEERMMADTPNEMITVYHDKDGKLALTHYCMLCNRPKLTLVKSDDNSLSFDLDKDSDIKVESEKHMHSATITFVDADHYTADWTGYEKGKEKNHHIAKFERVKL